jgi:hypothetical protein
MLYSQISNETRFQMIRVYKYKDKHADYFCTKSLSDYQTLLSQNFFAMLEDRDQTGRRLFLFKMGKLTDPVKWSSVKKTHTQRQARARVIVGLAHFTFCRLTYHIHQISNIYIYIYMCVCVCVCVFCLSKSRFFMCVSSQKILGSCPVFHFNRIWT